MYTLKQVFLIFQPKKSVSSHHAKVVPQPGGGLSTETGQRSDAAQ